MKLRFETRFRELDWLWHIVIYIIWLVQASNIILNSSPLGKSWSNKSSNYVYGLYHFLGVFRRLREIWRAEMLGASQINYSRSIRIRQCMRGVSEKSVWLPILAPKFFHATPNVQFAWKSRKSWKINEIEIWDQISGAELTWAYRGIYYMACSDKQYYSK